MKQIEVQILQQSYVLTCPDGQEERLLEAVRRVDTAMTRIRDSGKVRSRERVAVLSALNMADRKSTRLNSSHLVISYAVFCLKKKKNLPSLRWDLVTCAF